MWPIGLGSHCHLALGTTSSKLWVGSMVGFRWLEAQNAGVKTTRCDCSLYCWSVNVLSLIITWQDCCKLQTTIHVAEPSSRPFFFHLWYGTGWNGGWGVGTRLAVAESIKPVLSPFWTQAPSWLSCKPDAFSLFPTGGARNKDRYWWLMGLSWLMAGNWQDCLLLSHNCWNSDN